MNRLGLEKMEYLTLEELVFYVDAKPAKVKKWIADKAFKVSPMKEDLYLVESINKFMLTGKYLNGYEVPKRVLEAEAIEAEKQRIQALEEAEEDYSNLIDSLPEKHKELNFNSDATVAGILRKHGLINSFS